MHDIEPRDVRFDLTDVPKAWHGGQLSVSLFFDALSVFFPVGERFFVKTVKAYRDEIDDVGLKADVAAFCAQEGHHGREHDRYNDMLRQQGLPVDALERQVVRLLGVASAVLPKRRQLAVTCALEHFTSLLGVLVLDDPKTLEGAHPTMAALWKWHAAEENEHKAVAFDVYRRVGGGTLARSWQMLVVTMMFWLHVAFFHLRFMHAAGILFSLKEHVALARYLVGGERGLQDLVKPYFRYFSPSFHPNEIDTQPLVERWKAGYSP